MIEKATVHCRYAINMGLVYRLTDRQFAKVMRAIINGEEVGVALTLHGKYLGKSINVTDFTPEDAADEMKHT